MEDSDLDLEVEFLVPINYFISFPLQTPNYYRRRNMPKNYKQGIFMIEKPLFQ